MEVDRISRIGPLTPQASPAWQKSSVRRRKFVEEIQDATEDESESGSEESPPPHRQPAKENPGSFSASDDSAPESPASPQPGFRAIA